MFVGLTFTTEPFLCVGLLPFTETHTHTHQVCSREQWYSTCGRGVCVCVLHWLYPGGLWGGEIGNSRGSINGEKEEEDDEVLFPAWVFINFCKHKIKPQTTWLFAKENSWIWWFSTILVCLNAVLKHTHQMSFVLLSGGVRGSCAGGLADDRCQVIRLLSVFALLHSAGETWTFIFKSLWNTSTDEWFTPNENSSPAAVSHWDEVEELFHYTVLWISNSSHYSMETLKQTKKPFRSEVPGLLCFLWLLLRFAHLLQVSICWDLLNVGSMNSDLVH